MWSEGTIRIPDAKDKGKNTVCHYWVKHYEEPSRDPRHQRCRISKKMATIRTANYIRKDRTAVGHEIKVRYITGITI